MPKSKLVNLLPQEEFDASILGRVLKWATGTFRIIVIVTEMIVMAAFLSRFWLDAQNSELSETIDIKGAQIESQSDFETSFRRVQKKLDIYEAITPNQSATTKLSLVTSKVPQDIVLSGLTINDNSSQVKGISQSEIGIAQFISNLQAETSYKNVDLGSLTTSEDDPLSTVFSIGITY
jgi:Tfp pilus assembly protein PilN